MCLVNPEPSSLNLGMVIIKDGFKGCSSFIDKITSPEIPGVPENQKRKKPHDALCVRHLAGSARVADTKGDEEKKKGLEGVKLFLKQLFITMQCSRLQGHQVRKNRNKLSTNLQSIILLLQLISRPGIRCCGFIIKWE